MAFLRPSRWVHRSWIALLRQEVINSKCFIEELFSKAEKLKYPSIFGSMEWVTWLAKHSLVIIHMNLTRHWSRPIRVLFESSHSSLNLHRGTAPAHACIYLGTVPWPLTLSSATTPAEMCSDQVTDQSPQEPFIIWIGDWIQTLHWQWLPHKAHAWLRKRECRLRN